SDMTKTAPAIIGVCEIENRTVLEDLVKMPALKKYNYEVVHYESPDKRGVDVGLLYQPSIFTVKSSVSATLKIEDIEDFYTRDQLVVSGELDGEMIHVIVNHWPSRYGGEKRSAPLRNAAADLTRSLVDSIMIEDKNAKIIIMGDLNDDPINESLIKHLKANKEEESTNPGELYNATYPLFQKGIGSLAYRDNWNLFDQMVVSYPLLGKDKTTFKLYKTFIFDKEFLKQESGRYKGYPLRTHAGGVYKNGYSDHFPVFIYLIKEI
ncbi:endonuclease/exonuclease/phosphatase family protein, partial [Bacteroidota bacterium]